MYIMNNLLITILIIKCVIYLTKSSSEFSPKDINTNLTTTSTNNVVKRSKRYLDLIPKSRVFFRVNVKDNIIQLNQLWAHAYGYRANFPIENRRRMKRSDVYVTLEELISQHGFDGRACVLKTFCDASKKLTPDSGLLFKLFKLMFAYSNTTASGSNRLPEGDEKLYPYLNSNNCDELYTHCPLALLDLSPYTDI